MMWHVIVYHSGNSKFPCTTTIEADTIEEAKEIFLAASNPTIKIVGVLENV